VKKWIIVGVVVLIGGYAVVANIDARGVARTCVEATPTDGSGTLFRYALDGKTATYQMPGSDKIIGLKEGEPVGLSFVKGRLSGIQYEERFYLLSKAQSERVYEFGIQRSGAGQQATATPVKHRLPVGCPSN
jgi:hypothetical protein